MSHGRFVYAMNVSLDLFIDHHPGEAGGGQWLRIDDELHREFNDRTRQMAALVQGRVIHEIMESYWPTAAEDPHAADVMREYGRIWTQKPKYLVSTTRTSADHNTQIIGGADVIDQLRSLRDRLDGDIGVGGATLATSLLRHGLLDDVLLTTHPVLLGSGRPLFDALPGVIDFEVVDHRRFDSGVTMQRVRITSIRRTTSP
jgi:dihydrofolate reductase